MLKGYKMIIAGIFSVAIIVGGYFGAYLPLEKSQLYINGAENFSYYAQEKKPLSLKEFSDLFSPAFDYYSPIGQEEIISAYMGILYGMIGQTSNKEVIDYLATQAGDLMKASLEAKKGFSYSQNIYLLGSIYKVAYMKTGNNDYYQKSMDLFNEGLRFSPNRQIFLEGVFDLYGIKGDKENLKKIGNLILKYWPNDEGVKQVLDKIK